MIALWVTSRLPVKVFGAADRDQTIRVRQLRENANLVVVLELHAHCHDRGVVSSSYIGVFGSEYRANALSGWCELARARTITSKIRQVRSRAR